MSHLPERKEKNCLNCGTEVHGKYCHVCGQENLEPKESFWHLLTHFFYDFTHFDGKFFSTVRYLLSRPGFLTSEYAKGRRASYLHPIRMYVFTSAFFFIIFFWVFSLKNVDFGQAVNIKADSTSLLKGQELALSKADTHKDSVEILQAMEQLRSNISKGTRDSVQVGDKNIRFFMDTSNYKNVAAYDSAQKLLPENRRDGRIKRIFRKKEINIRNTYRGNSAGFWRDVLNNFLHQFPKLFFLSLPLFALILKLLYIRRKQFYYADHAIFTIHLYIFSYIFFLIFFGVQKLDVLFPSGIWNWIEFGLWLYWLYYTYKAMRNFYKQRRGKTIVKYLLLNFLAFISILILFTIFFFLSVLQI